MRNSNFLEIVNHPTVASSGIAATLLDGGRTAHSTFKISINVARQQHPVCNIAKHSDLAKLIRQCQLIIFDESTMSHNKLIEAQ